MMSSEKATGEPAQPAVYEIRVQGHLGRQWTGWFGDASVALEASGTTLLTCAVVDQAALHALLRKVRDLGVTLHSIRRRELGASDVASNDAGAAQLSAPLQVELFVADLDASIAFYTRILGFEMGERQTDGYAPLANGPVGIALNARATLPEDHPIYLAPGERPGRGVEFVLWAADLHALYAHVQERGWPISGALQRQPWGLDDFRLQDPDGYYLRLTARP